MGFEPTQIRVIGEGLGVRRGGTGQNVHNLARMGLAKVFVMYLLSVWPKCS